VRAGLGIVGDAQRRVRAAVFPQAVVGGGREPDRAAVEDHAFAAVEAVRAIDLVTTGDVGRTGVRVRHAMPAHAGAVADGIADDFGDLEHAGGQVRPACRAEAVEAAVAAAVLGHVDRPAGGVDRAGLVAEAAHGRSRDALAGPVRIAFPDQAAVVFLARQPGVPRRRPAGAVDARAGKDAVGCGW